MLHTNKTTATVKSIKFLGLTIDTILNWKHHISNVKPKLNKACYAIRSIKPFMSLAVLKSTYYSYALLSLKQPNRSVLKDSQSVLRG